jgi:hypothetical protein
MLEFKFRCEGKNDFMEDRIDFRLEPTEDNILFVEGTKGIFRLFSVTKDITDSIIVGTEYIISISPVDNDTLSCKLMTKLMDIDGVAELPYDSIEAIRRIICGTHNGVCLKEFSGNKQHK